MRYMNLLRSRAKMVRDWRIWVGRIADAAEQTLPDVEVYVVGSVVRGDWVGGSDVDILLVSRNLPEGMLGRAEIRSQVEDGAKLPAVHPFEIHLVSPGEAEAHFRKAGKDIVKHARCSRPDCGES
ncbi:MAG: nucleotidyltransferase domain-containing protein [Candidatus Bathyarchaeia archaeon]